MRWLCLRSEQRGETGALTAEMTSELTNSLQPDCMAATVPHAEASTTLPRHSASIAVNLVHVPLTWLSKLLRTWEVHFTSLKPLLKDVFSTISTWNTLLFMNS